MMLPKKFQNFKKIFRGPARVMKLFNFVENSSRRGDFRQYLMK